MDTQDKLVTGYCKVSVASLRMQADNGSPLLSQILFGEKVSVIRKKSRNWIRVQCDWDNTIGYADPKQFYIEDDNKINKVHNCQTYALDLLHPVSSEQTSLPIIIGSNLYNCDGLNVKMPFGKFQYGGQIIDLNQSRLSRRLLVNVAKRYLHAPYLFGGRSILGTDSTGFIQQAYKMVGIQLPRFSHEMVTKGQDVGFVNEAREGDIAFFENKSGEIVHAGMILETGKVLHAYGKVRADFLDQQGIYVKRRRSYLYNLRSIRKYF